MTSTEDAVLAIGAWYALYGDTTCNQMTKALADCRDADLRVGRQPTWSDRRAIKATGRRLRDCAIAALASPECGLRRVDEPWRAALRCSARAGALASSFDDESRTEIRGLFASAALFTDIAASAIHELTAASPL